MEHLFIIRRQRPKVDIMKINILEKAVAATSTWKNSRALRHRWPWALPMLIVPVAVVATLLWTSRAARAETVGRAEAEIDNARSDRQETPWGRLVSDAVRATGADIALVNAGVLGKGKLNAGEIDSEEIEALLAYPDEEIVIVTLSGAQLRAGLERAVSAFPTGSPAWLHGSGLEARFSPSQNAKPRLTSLFSRRDAAVAGQGRRGLLRLVGRPDEKRR